MASTYVNDLRLNEMATGDASGSWGTVTNTNLELIAEAFSFGTEGITTNADTHTTTIADGATDPGRSMFLKYTGTLDSACTITIAPNTVSKLWFIENATSGSQNIIIKQGSGATITIPPGDTKAIYSDGAGSGGKMVDAFASLSVVDLNVSGNLDVDGTTNLDAVDIDGAVNMATTALVTGVLTTTAATVFNGGFAANDGSTISTADNTTQLTLESTSANATIGPVLDLFRNSASPANFDPMGKIIFSGEDSGGNKTEYAHLQAYPQTVTGGSESGYFEIHSLVGGTDRVRIEANATAVVINNPGIDSDFIVESNNNANMLFVDGGEDAVGIGTVPPAWRAGLGDVGFNVGVSAALYDQAGGAVFLVNNWYRADDNTLTYRNTNEAQYMVMDGGITSFANAASGSAGSAITFTETLNIAADGSLSTPTAGTSNFKAGVNAGNSIASGGIQNVFVGDEAGTAIVTGDYNTAVGYKALFSDTEGNRSVAIGREALLTQNFTSGTSVYNTAVGYGAGLSNATGVQNTILGGLSGYYGTTADNSTFVGYGAGFGNDGAPLTGNNNTAVGTSAGLVLQGAANNNTFMGVSSGQSNTTGTQNTAVGVDALKDCTTSSNNTAIGVSSLENCTGALNVALGITSGIGITSGEGNIAIGYNTCAATLTSNNNTVVGRQAGASVTSGSNNTLIGALAGDQITSGHENVCVGYDTNPSVVGGFNQIVLGESVTGNSNSSLCFGAGATDSAIAFGATSITAPSDQRYKEEIADATAGLAFIKDLRPVTFKWKKEKDVPSDHPAYVEGSDTRVMNDYTNHGFIAQEVKTAIDNHSDIKDGFDMWSEQGSGGRQRLGPSSLIPMLVKAIQELEARIAVLEG